MKNIKKPSDAIKATIYSYLFAVSFSLKKIHVGIYRMVYFVSAAYVHNVYIQKFDTSLVNCQPIKCDLLLSVCPYFSITSFNDSTNK